MTGSKSGRMIPDERQRRIGKLRRGRSRVADIIEAKKRLLFGVEIEIEAQNVRIVFDFIVGVKTKTAGVQSVANFKTVCRITRSGISKNRQRNRITAVGRRKNCRDL